MTPFEMSTLRAVLPRHIKLATESPDGPVLHDTVTDNVTRIGDCRSAAEAIGNLLHDARAVGHAEGAATLAARIGDLLPAATHPLPVVTARPPWLAALLSLYFRVDGQYYRYVDDPHGAMEGPLVADSVDPGVVATALADAAFAAVREFPSVDAALAEKNG